MGILKISWMSVKNAVRSKGFLIGVLASFAYVSLWLIFFKDRMRGTEGFTAEFSRLFYLFMLYASALIVGRDLEGNVNKTIYTGIYSRFQIGISKVVALIILGGIVSFIVEVDRLFVSIVIHGTAGVRIFLELNHISTIMSYILIIFVMGGLMVFISVKWFCNKKTIMGVALFLAMVNFYGSAVNTMVIRNPEFAEKIKGYIATPFYNTTYFMFGMWSAKAAITMLIWGIVFSASTMFVIKKMEVR